MMNRPSGSEMFFFSPSDVSAGRNYAGMILSHFSHADGAHLLFNMVTLYSLGPTVEGGLGPLGMLLVYVTAGIVSTVVVYFRHRREPGYRCLGASDSVSGIVFAAIIIWPQMRLSLMFIPYPIPATVFAVGYIVVSTYLMRRGRGHISHEAHLAGAFCGLILGGLLWRYGFGPLLYELKSFVR